MATKKEMSAELNKLGVKFDPQANAKDLEALLVEAKKNTTGGSSDGDNTGGDNSNAGNGTGASKNEAKNKGDVKYVWLKQRAYISENQRIDAGFYAYPIAELPARLSKISSANCEMFDVVPRKKIYDIAKWSGVNVDNFVGEDAELLSKLISEPKPFI